MNKWKFGTAPTMRETAFVSASSFIVGFALTPVLNALAGN